MLSTLWNMTRNGNLAVPRWNAPSACCQLWVKRASGYGAGFASRHLTAHLRRSAVRHHSPRRTVAMPA
jgi:hypothetical protein